MRKIVYLLALFFATVELSAQEIAPKEKLRKANQKECLEYAKKETEYVDKLCKLSPQQKQDLFFVLEGKYAQLADNYSAKNVERVSNIVAERMRVLLGAEKFEKLASEKMAIAKLTGLVYLKK